MLKSIRQQELLKIIKSMQTVAVTELIAEVSCSRATLQRDLSELENDGLISRSFGQVTYLQKDDQKEENSPYLSEDRTANLNAKIMIGRYAQSIIEDEDTVFITHGTTTRQIVREMDKKNITIVTDGLDIIYGCSTNKNVRVLAIGGICNFETMQMEYIPAVAEQLKYLNVNRLFTGVAGISLDKGITFYDYASYELLMDIVEQVNDIIVVADSTKFGKVALANCLSLEKVKKIITDKNVPQLYIEAFQRLGIECIAV